MRLVRTGFITNIDSYDRQYPYRETEFFDFGKFLFLGELQLFKDDCYLYVV